MSNNLNLPPEIGQLTSLKQSSRSKYSRKVSLKSSEIMKAKSLPCGYVQRKTTNRAKKLPRR